MTAWLSRNTVPILLTIAASAVVIGAFEVLDAFAASDTTVAAADEGEAVELDGIASVAGLIKVMLFLAVGVGLTALVRRSLNRGSA